EAEAKIPPVEGMVVDLELPAEVAAPGAPIEPPARSQFELFRRRFLRHRVAVIALVVLVALYVIVIFAKQIAPHPPNPRPLPLLDANQSPSWHHWFGTYEP